MLGRGFSIGFSGYVFSHIRSSGFGTSERDLGLKVCAGGGIPKK